MGKNGEAMGGGWGVDAASKEINLIMEKTHVLGREEGTHVWGNEGWGDGGGGGGGDHKLIRIKRKEKDKRGVGLTWCRS